MKDKKANPLPPAPLPIVGIGASAGGLEALSRLLRAVPADTGLGFVVVQHLTPDRPSLLAEILGRATSMPVGEVTDNHPVRPNHVCVIPPDRDVTISEGRLHLQPRPGTRGPHRPVDEFFRSLAEDLHHLAIGVILSGTATDGTLGLEEIKAEGGLTFAQDDSAQHDSMPRSAVAAGCVDFVLPPEGIAAELARIARDPYVAAAPNDVPPPADFARIMQRLRGVTGVDFTHYKASTLHRRINRRLVLHKMQSLSDYERLIREDPAEAEALYQDILISVTSFFRNPDTFEALKAKVLPRLFQDRSPKEPVRVWVLGCSTGEEAYSLAMTLTEVAEAQGNSPPAQIFASDLNQAGIETARAGVYSRSAVQDISPERRRRFFTETDGRFRVAKTIRDMCVFARHNALGDPPFSRMDLISCRNVLIYLEPELQRKILAAVHYALKPEGALVLGHSETTGPARELFETEDSRQKIYRRKPGPARLPFGFHGGHPATLPAAGPLPAAAKEPGAEVLKEADRILLARYAPPGVLVDADMAILQFRGDTGLFLTPAPGKASLNLLKMAREGLLVALRAVVQQAKKEGVPVRREDVRVRANGGYRKVNLEVVPVKGVGAPDGGFLVLFEEPARHGAVHDPPAESAAGAAISPEDPAESAERQVARLTQELESTREYLQATIEEQEAANEELQSSNEEAQSANEELQSLNEELETSKEEIQSSNEELATVNDELQNRNAELHEINGDLRNLIDSVRTAIVIVGRDLRIRRFSPEAEERLNLIPTDLGRPIGDIRLNLSLPDLKPLLEEVIDTLTPAEREVQDGRGRWCSLRVRPYLTLDNKIDGAVLMLVDVDRLKRAREYAESILATVREPLLVLTEDLRVKTAGPAFYRDFGVTPEETEGRLLYELGSGQWNLPELRRLLEQILPEGGGLEDYQVEHAFPGREARCLLLNARRIAHESEGEEPLILLVLEDVTERRAAEAATAHLAAIVTSSEDAIISKDLNGVITSWNRGAEHLYGYSPAETIGRPVTLLIPEDHLDEEPRILEQVRRGEVIEHYETVRRRKDGTLVDVSLTVSPLRNAAGTVVGASNVTRDVSARMRAEAALRESLAQLQAHADDLSRFNQVAVGRELRMIELKEEINALSVRLGEPSRYDPARRPEA